MKLMTGPSVSPSMPHGATEITKYIGILSNPIIPCLVHLSCAETLTILKKSSANLCELNSAKGSQLTD